MLQVRIHHHNKVPCCILQTGKHTGFLAEIAGKGYVPYPLVLGGKLPQLRQRLVP